MDDVVRLRMYLVTLRSGVAAPALEEEAERQILHALALKTIVRASCGHQEVYWDRDLSCAIAWIDC